ncbi:MAG: pentapeptide repeat-containing protein [Gammaproteobacteria bacterium]|nr:pentapeptide repeat-containing protein [Gammaproteobacteria bacterium]
MDYKADSAAEHVRSWKSPWLAWSIGLPFWVLQKVTEWYTRTKLAEALRVLEPLGIATAMLALVCTVIALALTVGEIERARKDREEERKMRQSTLLAVLYERLEEARRKDDGMKPEDKRARAGQIPIFEELVRLKSNLSSVDASGVNLSWGDDDLVELGAIGIALDGGKLRLAKLNQSNLTGAQFVGADLWKADFRESYLQWATFSCANLGAAEFRDAIASDVGFKYANLGDARFDGAELRHAKLDGANVAGASFLGARGLTQTQLDRACSTTTTGPSNLPLDSRTKKKLVWNGSRCGRICW